jgi:hypothetical protein
MIYKKVQRKNINKLKYITAKTTAWFFNFECLALFLQIRFASSCNGNPITSQTTGCFVISSVGLAATGNIEPCWGTQ